ncbi:MAG: hypothetical protein RJA78_900 [Actinomycetota bacterium]
MRASYLKPIVALVLFATLGSVQSASASPGVSGISTTAYNEGNDKAAVFYNPLVVSGINLTLPPASFNELNNNPGTTVYQTASVTITTADGVATTLNNIGVRLKGQATRTNLYGKAPMKLKFDAFVPDQKFLGLTRMTLNSMVQDPSFVHEDSAYRLYRAMGITAPRTTYSWVKVNGADFGLYMNVESIDSQMLKRWMTVRHLYSSNCYLADITPEQSGCYDTNYGDDDRSDLRAAIATSSFDGADWWREINKVADMTAVINLMATDIYTSNWDGYTDVVQNNYYLAFDTDGKFRIIPWGQDGAFPMDSAAQLDWLGRGPAYRNFGNQQRSVILRKCVAYAPCTSLLIKAQVKAKETAEKLDMPGFKNKIAAVINTAYISQETRANSDIWSAQYWQNWLDSFFPMRTASLTEFLKTRAPEAADLTVTGEAKLGSTLTANAITWDFTSSLSYQWLRDGANIPNASTNAYSLTEADLGKSINVKVTTSKTGFSNAFVSSTPVLVTNPKASAASFTGTGTVGSPLTAAPASSASVQVSYQWLRSGKAISGAINPTYTPTSLDYLKPISVTTKVTQSGFPVTTTTSPAVVIKAGTIPTVDLGIAGSPVMAQTLLLTANVPYGTKATYQWLNEGVAIPSSTRTSYKLKSTDVGKNISVRVTLTKTAYIPLVLVTDSILIEPGTQAKQPTVSITGLTKISKTLTGVTGSWDSSVKLTYQWLRDGQPIAGAIAKTYKLTANDLYKAISFRVTSTKAGYTTVVAISAPTALITN